MSGGRPPGRALSPLELRHLRLLLEVRARAHKDEAVYNDELEDFVLDCRESGCSARSIAEALEVSSSTVQTWTMNARRRQAGS